MSHDTARSSPRSAAIPTPAVTPAAGPDRIVPAAKPGATAAVITPPFDWTTRRSRR